ncbi:CLUMA_CG001794, isoform A [Clunio marinus]|uniref:CLUMA_CG001794, isoform A n=1 Tax=Clunio marinus TaxID=568069 RepID=A0A1J1HIX9_9DIPT|nr:CLUMA_CG001794, isoform A [Clunio marinus]
MSSPKAAISELSESRNHQLRMFAIFMMPNLIHYNDKKITDEERYHANNYHKCLGPIECKLLNYKAYPPVEDLKKLIPESIQESDDEISKLDDHDYIMNVEKGLSSFNLSLYFKNPDKKNATNDLELLLKRRAK